MISPAALVNTRCPPAGTGEGRGGGSTTATELAQRGEWTEAEVGKDRISRPEPQIGGWGLIWSAARCDGSNISTFWIQVSDTFHVPQFLQLNVENWILI